MSSTPVLVVDRARKVFRGADSEVVALDEVSIEVSAGEVLAVVGPSGSGKTTLLMLAGLIELPTSGQVRLLGEVTVGPNSELARLTDLRRRRIGFVFQRSNLIPFLTALENVQIAMQLDRASTTAARARAVALLGEFGVAYRASNLPRQLSGGEQQRVAIARALANRPAIVFADEPTAALDSRRGLAVMELFRRLARDEGVALVVVTHDPRAAALADRVVEMVDGRVQRQYVNPPA